MGSGGFVDWACPTYDVLETVGVFGYEPSPILGVAMRRLLSIAAALALSGPGVAAADGARSALLRVLYVGDKGSPRARSYEKFLSDAFIFLDTVDRRAFDPASANNADVVVLDWPEEGAGGSPTDNPAQWEQNVRSPLGDRTNWQKPTVLIGTASHLVARSWKVFGANGCTCFSPAAYDLRDHPIYDHPEPIERTKLTRRPWPEEWTEWHDDEAIGVLPLLRPGKKPPRPGWCTYPRDMAEAPEVEVFSGGLNTMTSTAVALWRQGNLLHFGFDAQPDELNATGKALLINSIAYIARFVDDRPILETPSSFMAKPVLLRSTIVRIIARNSSAEWEYLKANFDPAVLSSAGIKKLSAFAGWYPTVREFLIPNDQGLMTVDNDALALYLKPARPDFFPRVIAKLARPATDVARALPGTVPSHARPASVTAEAESAAAAAADDALARRLLVRYAPNGLGPGATAKQWAAWWKANGDYLFFAEIGGYRWYVDPLAQARKTPTVTLRGEKRANH